MIQTVLIFLFGFLCAAILALMVAPPIWHRATVLTQRRIEAAGPRTLAEIQADKDGIRAGWTRHDYDARDTDAWDVSYVRRF